MAQALVAEDAEAVRRLLTVLLRRQGLQVFAAKTGREALDELGKHDFDLILLDLMMPEVSGYEVLEFIRKERPDWVKRLILVTAASNRELDQVLGVSPEIRVIRKPFDINELTSAVKSQLSGSEPEKVLVSCLACDCVGAFPATSEKEAWEFARQAAWHVVTFVKEDTGSGKLKTLAITFCPKCAGRDETVEETR